MGLVFLIGLASSGHGSESDGITAKGFGTAVWCGVVRSNEGLKFR